MQIIYTKRPTQCWYKAPLSTSCSCLNLGVVLDSRLFLNPHNRMAGKSFPYIPKISCKFLHFSLSLHYRMVFKSKPPSFPTWTRTPPHPDPQSILHTSATMFFLKPKACVILPQTFQLLPLVLSRKPKLLTRLALQYLASVFISLSLVESSAHTGYLPHPSGFS